mmetsp:Transcript_73922/g.222271  ORF Transcript_73922/g.222271 Transcript_73922/m.222271 type:complete len:486 (-) Transcript_73922:584-2041(-)
MLVLSLSACAYQLHVVPSARRTVRQAAHAARMAAAAIDEQQASGSRALLDALQPDEEPSFNSMWYAVGFSSSLSADTPFGTRLWGEPIVLYRDAAGEAVCLKDVCPHRSAPLSMGSVEGGELRCFYHGWAFGADGECVDVPTFRPKTGGADERKQQLKRFGCADQLAVVEQGGLLWVWRGNPLSADLHALPAPPEPDDAALFTCDTVLDFACDWGHVAENYIDSPHLYWLHDGWIPPLEAFGFTQGQPSPAWTCQKGSSKVVQHSAPNIIHRRGASGFAEEVHVVPIAGDRTRVLLRQRFPRDNAVLARLLGLPVARPFLTWLVQNWNYHIALEDYPTQQQQLVAPPERGAPEWRRAPTRLADDTIAQLREWRARAQVAEGTPYFGRWDGADTGTPSAYGCTDKFGPQKEDAAEGTYGLKRSYVQMTPKPEFAPMNVGPYKQFLQTWQALQNTAAAGAVSVPAFFATYKTIGPAVADLGSKASGM